MNVEPKVFFSFYSKSQNILNRGIHAHSLDKLLSTEKLKTSGTFQTG